MATYGLTVKETVRHPIILYTFYKGEEIGYVQMSKSTEMIEEEEIPVIRVMNIFVEERYRGMGYSKLMIVYGIYMCRNQYPEIQFSALDDDSDAAHTPCKNLYWKCGYVPKDNLKETILLLPKYLRQTQSEMILDFDSIMHKDFINNLLHDN
jgi:GNAT superfamily N-acetyltransferase